MKTISKNHIVLGKKATLADYIDIVLVSYQSNKHIRSVRTYTPEDPEYINMTFGCGPFEVFKTSFISTVREFGFTHNERKIVTEMDDGNGPVKISYTPVDPYLPRK